MNQFLRHQLLIWLLAGLLAACSEAVPDGRNYEQIDGMHAVVSMNGQAFDMTISSDGNLAPKFDILWNDHLLTSRTLHRGLYPLRGSDRKTVFTNEFETAAIDSLFPLQVGKDAVFDGTHRVSGLKQEGRFWVYMTVLEESRLKIRDKSFDVFKISIDTEMTINDRTVRYSRLVYYAPALGMSLKTVIEKDGATHYWRILSLEEGEGVRHSTPAPLGTVMI